MPCDRCQELTDEQLDELAEKLAGATLVARVDLSLATKEGNDLTAAKSLIKRFQVDHEQRQPTLILFRDRKVCDMHVKGYQCNCSPIIKAKLLAFRILALRIRILLSFSDIAPRRDLYVRGVNEYKDSERICLL